MICEQPMKYNFFEVFMKKLEGILFAILNFIGLIGIFTLSRNFIPPIFIISSILIVFDVLFLLAMSKLNKKNKMVQTELSETRNELTKTIEEMSIASSELEAKTQKMQVVEQDLSDTQEELTEIVSELSIHSKQMEDILNNITAGVCTITQDLKIESNFNNQFRNIFGNKEYWEQSIIDSIFVTFDSKTKHEIQEFFEMVFSNSSVSLDMLNDANPVKKFTYLFNEAGNVQKKEIKTSVIPISNEDKVEKVILLFWDVTYEEELAKSIKAEKEAFQNELNLITTIFRNDRDVVVEFLNDLPETQKLIKEIIDTFELNANNKTQIFRLVGLIHSLKGESLALGFESLGKSCQKFEAYLKTVAEEVIDLNCNLEITNLQIDINQNIDKILEVGKKLFQLSEDSTKFGTNLITFPRSQYEELLKRFDEMKTQYDKNQLEQKKIEEFRKQLGQFLWTPLVNMEKELFLLTEKTAAKLNKNVKLQIMFEVPSLPISAYKFLKEVFIHLIRNSIAHGIEEKDKRLASNKVEQGRINIHITKEDGSIQIYYSDDGQGLNPVSIKQKAIENNLLSEQEVENMQKEEIMQLIFSDGFSTKAESDEVSGTGVGMSVVKNNIVNFLHGKIRLENKAPNGIGLKLIFPEPK